MEFAGSHSAHIEAIAALVQIVLWGGAGVLALVQVWGLRRRAAPEVIVLHPGSEPMSPDALWRVIGERRPAPDLARVTERYLEHLVDRYRHLDFRGMGVSDRAPLRLPLLDMYIPLKARVDPAERARREDPAGPGARVLLGGSYLGSPTDNRCTVRLGELPTLRDKLIGFRIAVVPE